MMEIIRIRHPAVEAIRWVRATVPNVPRISGRAVESWVIARIFNGFPVPDLPGRA